MSLAARLRERRSEIEQAVLTRAHSLSDPAEVENPEYVIGLRSAVCTAIDFALAALEGRDVGLDPVPAPLLTQARFAARSRISLDVVLRRYFAGYSLLSEFVTNEAESDGPLGSEEALRLSRVQASLFDRLIAAVTEEYTREAEAERRSLEHARAARVKRLLAGELIDDPQLGYVLGGRWHLGLVAEGPGLPQALRRLAGELGRSRLLIRPGEGMMWAWLGAKRKVPAEEVAEIVYPIWPQAARVAIGEPSEGIAGWRLTHRQALAAMSVVLREGKRVALYRDVALLSCAMSDETLSRSLHELYLAPLAREPDEGATLRQTLRAYFASGRNISSTAAKLEVSRNTVGSRLRTVEECIGRSLDECAVEMETALRLQNLLLTGANATESA